MPHKRQTFSSETPDVSKLFLEGADVVIDINKDRIVGIVAGVESDSVRIVSHTDEFGEPTEAMYNTSQLSGLKADTLDAA